jgi:uncharacterized protein (DUF4415 family)
MRFATGRAEEPAKPSQARRSLRNGCSRFDDPYAITQRDATFEDKQRWIAVGAIGPVSILLVVHTFYEEHNEEVIRVTSARAANRTKGEPMRKLTKEQKRDIRAIAAKRDQNIDFSDAPAVVDWSEAEIGKFYRPTKKPVTMRLDSDVIAWLKADGPGYQTKANWLLRQAMIHLTETGTVRGKRRHRRSGEGQ